MRLAAVLALLLAACAGCRQFMPILDEKGRPVAKSNAPWRNERMAGGLTLAQVQPTASEAAEAPVGGRLDDAFLAGVHVMYLFPASKYGPKYLFATRCGVEVRVDDYEMLLSSHGFKYGTLHMTPTVLAFRFMQMPEEIRILGFHVELGIGASSATFAKHAMLEEDDKLNGRHTHVSPEVAVVAVGGAGVDFYIAPRLCLSLGYRYSYSRVPVDWKVDGIPLPEIDELDASSHQVSLSLRFFF